MNEREKFFFFSFFLIIFLSFPPFSISSLSFFLLFNPNQFVSFIASSLLNHLAVFITFFLFVILFFLLFSLCLVLFHFLSLRLCKLFSFIHLEYCSVVISFSFPFYLYLFCVFHFSKMLFFFFFQHAAILIERFGQSTCMTNMTKEQNEMLMLYPFAIGRCCTGPYVVRTDRNH